MSKRITTILLSVLTGLALVAGLSAGPAHADTPPVPAKIPSCAVVNINKDTGVCADAKGSKPVNTIKPVVTSSVTHINGVSVKSSVTVLKYVQAKGATKAQKKGKKYKLKKGKTYWTSYTNARTGKEAWHKKRYGSGKVFIKGGDGWYHDPDCWNKVKVKTKKKIKGQKVYGAVKIVRYATFTGSSTAKVADYVTSLSKAWAHAYDSDGKEICKAYAEGNGSANYAASATARITGRYYVSLSAAVSGLAKGAGASLKAKLQGKTYVQIRADLSTTASGSATAKSKALAWVKCDTPPPTTEKPKVSMWEVNDVDEYDSTRACANYNVPGNHQATLKFDADYGSFKQDSFSVNGQGTQCTDYTAGERPASGTDTITVILRDNETGLSDDDSTTLKINAAPKPPN